MLSKHRWFLLKNFVLKHIDLPPQLFHCVHTFFFFVCIKSAQYVRSLFHLQLQKFSFHLMQNERQKEPREDKYTASLKYSLIYTQSLTTFDFNKNANTFNIPPFFVIMVDHFSAFMAPPRKNDHEPHKSTHSNPYEIVYIFHCQLYHTTSRRN